MDEYIASVFNTGHLDKQKKKLLDNGYEMYIVKQGCLVDDELWVHPDTISAYVMGTPNPKYVFIYKEKYLNEWSSTQTQRRYKKIPKKYYKFVGI